MIDLDVFREQLQARQRELQALSQESSASRDAVELDQQSVGRLSRMDAMQQQAMANATEARRATELREILAALQRIDTGAYGLCEVCDEEIAEKRLRLYPTVRLCVTCADRQE